MTKDNPNWYKDSLGMIKRQDIVAARARENFVVQVRDGQLVGESLDSALLAVGQSQPEELNGSIDSLGRVAVSDKSLGQVGAVYCIGKIGEMSPVEDVQRNALGTLANVKLDTGSLEVQEEAGKWFRMLIPKMAGWKQIPKT